MNVRPVVGYFILCGSGLLPTFRMSLLSYVEEVLRLFRRTLP
jgi:hypothetical protein